MQRKRDRLLDGLRAAGYDIHTPEGTFYLLPKSPIPDDVRFCEMLAEEDVFVLPGSICEIPGYFRITFTACASSKLGPADWLLAGVALA